MDFDLHPNPDQYINLFTPMTPQKMEQKEQKQQQKENNNDSFGDDEDLK